MKYANIYKVTFYIKPKGAKNHERKEVSCHVWRNSAKAALNQAWDWQEFDSTASFTATVTLEAEGVNESTWKSFRYYDGTWKQFVRNGDPTLP